MRDLAAIFFDIDNTLFATRDFAVMARRAAVNAMRDLGVELGSEELLQQLSEVVGEFGSNDEAHYAKLLKRLSSKTLGGKSPLVLEAAAVVAYQQTKYRHYKPHEDVTSVLAELAQMGLLLGILSNGRAIKQAEKLVRLGVLPFLHPRGIFISEDVGLAKPNPEAFLTPCRRFNLDPKQVMIVGDHPEIDVAPARALGMIAVQNCRNIGAQDKHPEADEHIHNFWDLLDRVRRDFKIVPRPDPQR